MNVTKTLSLTDFLLARIAEDEEAAREAITRRLDDYVGYGMWGLARVLVECEAKRRIVEQHEITEGFPQELRCPCGCEHVLRPAGPPSCEQCQTVPWNGGCFTLRALALPYADHPDYREEWRA